MNPAEGVNRHAGIPQRPAPRAGNPPPMANVANLPPPYVMEHVIINGVDTIKAALLKTAGKYKNQRVRLSCMALPQCDCIKLHELMCTSPSVVGLSLLQCEIKSEDLIFILSHIRDYYLTEIQLSKLPVGDDAAKYLAVGIQETNIKSLDLAWNDVTKVGARRIADALLDSPLEHLSLAQNNIGTDGVTWISQVLLTGRTMLKSLDVSSNNIIDLGAVALAEALPQSHLESLVVKYNHLTPRGVAVLCQAAIKSPSLTEIHISGNQLGNASCAISIADMLTNSNIEVLGIAHSNLTPNELPIIARGVNLCPTLRILKMGQNQFINDKSAIEFINTIRKHPNLTEVDFVDCNVSNAFQAYKNRIVRRMSAPITKILVRLIAILTIPRLMLLNEHIGMDVQLVRVLGYYLGEDGPVTPPAEIPVYRYIGEQQQQ